MDAGTDWTLEKLMTVIRYNRFPVTFSGGDPLYQAEQLIPLARAIKEEGLNLWCYTGFLYEEICDKEPYKTLLSYIDVLVDGPFMASRRTNLQALRFRGSDNQRFICPATGEEISI